VIIVHTRYLLHTSWDQGCMCEWRIGIFGGDHDQCLIAQPPAGGYGEILSQSLREIGAAQMYTRRRGEL